jgi:hypothetical protein
MVSTRVSLVDACLRIAIASDLILVCALAGDDIKMDGSNDQENGNSLDANGENHKGESGDQFARVVFCLDNAVEIAQSLQTGYQVITRICE